MAGMRSEPRREGVAARRRSWAPIAIGSAAGTALITWVGTLCCEVFTLTSGSFECELASGAEAPGVARRLLTEWFSSVVADGALTAARLLVSELVTNAVCHGRGRIMLRAQLFELRLLVEVLDDGDGFEPDVREREYQTPVAGGWGLSIVDSEASRWGVRRNRSHVWFELDLPAGLGSPPSC
jgi:anti-sigma regulatory factor (Ser/Thr protein kinase)